MTMVAFIFARGSSKGLPGTNIRPLGGKPLIAWSIEHALAVERIDRVIVSTDSDEIASISKHYGAEVPFIRPANLATDTANSVDVALHALDWYETYHGKVDGLLLLQPTSPFRSKSNVLRGIKLFHHSKFKK